MLSGVGGSGALTILGKSGNHFLFERDRLACSCQSRDVREIIRALRRSHGSVQLPRPRAIGAVEVFLGSTQGRDGEGNPALTLRKGGSDRIKYTSYYMYVVMVCGSEGQACGEVSGSAT